MLSLRGVCKSYHQPDGDVTVLQELCLELPAGQCAALLGESGSGKSTLLHLVAGLDHPDHGEIVIDGRSTAHCSERDWNALRRCTLGLVFQQYHLVPTLNVRDNMLLQARLAGRADPSLQRRLTGRLGLGALLDRLPHQLSGGQQQRVAIARALMHRPRLLLADEPTGNLDESTSHAVMALLVELVREADAALLLVTHSREMAAYLDSQWLLHNGRIRALSAAEAGPREGRAGAAVDAATRDTR
jgi:putative ABC transport system ATP-binding protein